MALFHGESPISQHFEIRHAHRPHARHLCVARSCVRNQWFTRLTQTRALTETVSSPAQRRTRVVYLPNMRYARARDRSADAADSTMRRFAVEVLRSCVCAQLYRTRPGGRLLEMVCPSGGHLCRRRRSLEGLARTARRSARDTSAGRCFVDGRIPPSALDRCLTTFRSQPLSCGTLRPPITDALSSRSGGPFDGDVPRRRIGS